jgi:hypothetical protein
MSVSFIPVVSIPRVPAGSALRMIGRDGAVVEVGDVTLDE